MAETILSCDDENERRALPVPMTLLHVQYVRQGESVYKVLVPTPVDEDEPTDSRAVNPIICQVQGMQQYKEENSLVEEPILGSFSNLSSKFKTVKSLVRLPFSSSALQSPNSASEKVGSPPPCPVPAEQEPKRALDQNSLKTLTQKLAERVQPPAVANASSPAVTNSSPCTPPADVNNSDVVWLDTTDVNDQVMPLITNVTSMCDQKSVLKSMGALADKEKDCEVYVVKKMDDENFTCEKTDKKIETVTKPLSSNNDNLKNVKPSASVTNAAKKTFCPNVVVVNNTLQKAPQHISKAPPAIINKPAVSAQYVMTTSGQLKYIVTPDGGNRTSIAKTQPLQTSVVNSMPTLNNLMAQNIPIFRQPSGFVTQIIAPNTRLRAPAPKPPIQTPAILKHTFPARMNHVRANIQAKLPVNTPANNIILVPAGDSVLTLSGSNAPKNVFFTNKQNIAIPITAFAVSNNAGQLQSLSKLQALPAPRPLPPAENVKSTSPQNTPGAVTLSVLKPNSSAENAKMETPPAPSKPATVKKAVQERLVPTSARETPKTPMVINVPPSLSSSLLITSNGQKFLLVPQKNETVPIKSEIKEEVMELSEISSDNLPVPIPIKKELPEPETKGTSDVTASTSPPTGPLITKVESVASALLKRPHLSVIYSPAVKKMKVLNSIGTEKVSGNESSGSEDCFSKVMEPEVLLTEGDFLDNQRPPFQIAEVPQLGSDDSSSSSSSSASSTTSSDSSSSSSSDETTARSGKPEIKLKLVKRTGPGTSAGQYTVNRYTTLGRPRNVKKASKKRVPDYSGLVKPCIVRVERLDLPIDDQEEQRGAKADVFPDSDSRSNFDSVLKMLQEKQAALEAIRRKLGKT